MSAPDGDVRPVRLVLGLALGRLEGRGRGSGVQVEWPIGVISDYRDGTIWRTRAFTDHGDALRAAGLRE